jgi:hypothetical protein
MRAPGEDPRASDGHVCAKSGRSGDAERIGVPIP